MEFLNEEGYLDLAKHILLRGHVTNDRTGVGTISDFAHQLTFTNIDEKFPLLTTKSVKFTNIAAELLWFISGSTNIYPLVNQGIGIWTEWPLEKYNREAEIQLSKSEFEERIRTEPLFAHKWGALGPTYGRQLRSQSGYDQLVGVIDSLKNDPHSRRHVISLWNSGDMERTLLPCCHGTVIQFYVRDNRLSCHMYQRSMDLFLGAPYNIASYALFTHLIAQQTGYKPKDLTISTGDVHIYQNHIPQIETQLERTPRQFPTLAVNHKPNIELYTLEDFKVEYYNPHPFIQAPVAV